MVVSGALRDVVWDPAGVAGGGCRSVSARTGRPEEEGDIVAPVAVRCLSRWSSSLRRRRRTASLSAFEVCLKLLDLLIESLLEFMHFFLEKSLRNFVKFHLTISLFSQLGEFKLG